ncbi:MAG: hypothetical protein RBT63_10975 [Bdellovibrionales bacterium]|jgi:hypothetical protein|nr:hypothetical protein [Bdellovibrionales bacterium]
MEQVVYLDTEGIGSTLFERSVDVHLVEGVEYLMKWYKSALDADLMIWFDSCGSIRRFQLNVMGQVTEWSCDHGLRTGLIVETEIQGVEFKLAEWSEAIRFDRDRDARALAISRRVVAAMPMSSWKAMILDSLSL